MIYSYSHSCGFSNRRFMQSTKNYLIIKCERCGLGVVAKAEKAEFTEPQDGMMGVVSRARS